MLTVAPHAGGLRVEAPAKINVGLRVLGKRPDGYHELESLVMAVSLADELQAAATDDGAIALEVVADGADAPADRTNLVWRAAEMLQSRCAAGQGCRITLVKRIPAGRGLGGGSSDAAAALVLLSRLWGLNVTPEALGAMAADLGSDVPFFLRGPLAVMRGRGEVLEPVAGDPPVHVVLVVPGFDCSTREVYSKVKLPLTVRYSGVSLWITHLLRGHVSELGRTLVNDLTPAAEAVCRDITTLCGSLRHAGASCVLMTGSGSAVFALAATESEARSIATAVQLDATSRVHVLKPWPSNTSLGWKGCSHGSDRSKGEAGNGEP